MNMNLNEPRIKVYTRSMNQLLWKRAMFLVDLPYPKIRITNSTAEGYLYQLVNDIEADFIINIDEDAFVYDLDALKDLIQYMIENDFVNCGMPDGGVVHLRRSNPLVTNPYFNIFNVSQIRKKFNIKTIENFPLYEDGYMKDFPMKLLNGNYNYGNDNKEPFYPFFIWMSQNFRTLYLTATNHPDGESTILYNHNNKPFLIHTWYSRLYNKDRTHTRRINNAFKECELLSDKKYKITLTESIIPFIRYYNSQFKLYKNKTVKFLKRAKNR